MKKPGCLGCLGYIVAISIAIVLIVYFFQNIVGFLGIGLFLIGAYTWYKSQKPIKKAHFSIASIVIGLLVSFIWFSNYHNTSAFDSDDSEIASNEVKDKTKNESSSIEKDEKNSNDKTKKDSTKTAVPAVTKTKEQTEKPKNKYPIATVTNVVDGDTIEVSLNGKEEEIRMLLIDTPETKDPSKPIEKFGPEASAYAIQVLEGKQVGIQVGTEDRDKYGRLLAYVWVGDTTYQEMILKQGLAATAYLYNDLTMLNEFHKAQDVARNKKIGVWSIPGYAHVDHDHGFHYEEKSKSESKPKEKPKQPVASTPVPKGECNIKGNQSGIYHVPGGQYYDITKAEETFCSEAEAVAAGYRKSKR